jgi:hypothetical protein
MIGQQEYSEEELEEQHRKSLEIGVFPFAVVQFRLDAKDGTDAAVKDAYEETDADQHQNRVGYQPIHREYAQGP